MELRREEGYAAELHAARDGLPIQPTSTVQAARSLPHGASNQRDSWVISEFHCSVIRIAEEFPMVCDQELQLIRHTFPDCQVDRVHWRLQEGHSCGFLLSPLPAHRPGLSHAHARKSWPNSKAPCCRPWNGITSGSSPTPCARCRPSPSARQVTCRPQPQIEDWAQHQSVIAEDPAFAQAFVDQLVGAGSQLLAIAEQNAVDPLALQLDHLVTWARHQADHRLTNPAPEATPPPG